MNSKEIINNIIEFKNPARLGCSFSTGVNDIYFHEGGILKENDKYNDFGYYDEILKEVPWFSGEVRVDPIGNIYGRLEGKTKGECIKGALEEGWELLETFKLPELASDFKQKLVESKKKNDDKFLLTTVGISFFSTMRDVRKLDNMFMDLLLEKENVIKLRDMVVENICRGLKILGEVGYDGIILYDDWGMQDTLMISPDLWREIFKPAYKKIGDVAKKYNLKYFVHSCGYIHSIIPDFIEAGVDVLQFDQPELYGSENLAKEFGGKVTFWSPVDIQDIMQTGNKELIQNTAQKMIDSFKPLNGGLIVKDYPSWADIDVKEEWAAWARNIFLGEINAVSKRI